MTIKQFIDRWKLSHPEEMQKYLEYNTPEELIDHQIGNSYRHGLWIQMELMDRQPERCAVGNDMGMSQLFADVFKDHCRYNVTAKEWFVFDGKVWKADPGGMTVSASAKRLTKALLAYGADLPESKERDSLLKTAGKYGNHKFRETMIRDARDVYPISQEDLDGRLELFNCQNGTYDLDEGVFYSHDAEDLLSKCSNVVYDPKARSPLFEQFVSDIMQGDQEKIDYLQKVFGYALTAETNLEACWILYGATTRNGKSTLVETLAYMMGNSEGYAQATQPETLAQKKNKDSRQASGDVARLKGCRFLNASEPPKRMLFDAALLKTLLGRDSITARQLYEREFEFFPHFKLFINTNYLPLIQDDSLFSSGRIIVIPFERHFSAQEQDRTLKDKLRTPENISGIFNWCLEGLRRFREEGLPLPDSVKAAIEEYRQSSDKVGNFIAECLHNTGRNSKGGEVYLRYSRWCQENGFGCENKGNFFDELKSKGLLAKSGKVNGSTLYNVVKGYEIIPELPAGYDVPLPPPSDEWQEVPEQLAVFP